MRVYEGYSGLADDARGAVIALGNFDGVHSGHRAVLDQARDLARDLGAPLGVALFQPHPRRFFAPDSAPFKLMSHGWRNEKLAAAGAAAVYALPFDAGMASMSPQAFVDTVLHAGLGIRGVVTGADFRFGKGRAGDADQLEALCAARGITARRAELFTDSEEKVSSSRIRQALAAGEVDQAALWLDGPWRVEGEVRHGDKRGRTIGFPTANVLLGEYTRPAKGVYAVRVALPGETIQRPGVANFGVRPTVDGSEERLEVHLFDFDGDIYGQTITIAFEAFLREERKFADFAALKLQIEADADAARQMLSATAGPA
ncbi:bifunctional riboflavin kinase/FAD synthetase [Maricaulis sp.]|uniref:bifunctional riboflavin kinase/FAD synthetase n=1 Tax=Maricaulis sp. TaxID=1486257 RepID=UPI002629AAD5|nr:bifunctional riboflavin kinase/FAD synthetase [Maricaulis sp.]